MNVHSEIRKYANQKIRKIAKEHGLPAGVTFNWSHLTLLPDKSKSNKKRLEVSITVPDATMQEVIDYTRDALLSWKGVLRLNDPMVKIKSVTVRSLRK